jgi:hypothetical protein
MDGTKMGFKKDRTVFLTMIKTSSLCISETIFYQTLYF